ncbi:MAG: cytochrome C oxidase subunit IV family protein [Actinomycetota bacterium]|nr:cytochrome C oxidase subunit IV family protein [Actinomycetota bacterium]
MTSDSALADVPGTSTLAHDEAHPTDTHYVRIAVLLAVMTAVEVALSYIHGLKGMLLVAPLLLIMALKFGIVALHFMHLKWDSKVLTRLFYAGLFLAVGVYVAALSTFRLFNNG